ncbi:hypothetical protein [Marisediminicola antarctica]|uniref:Uncharacterized protein n=1 Tax=Marisediminicola antarctica TaxID=674079 RepID=A0A7L5AIE4_9MICO|nr:hypothetical protein [Marisediminicola antarctica]QHO69555.1 hypothetical protein BHD05_07785 [Marisediminicola antarctica]
MIKQRSVIALVVGLVLTMGVVAPASALQPDNSGNPELAELRDFFDEYGVGKGAQGKLIAKHLSGGTWEAASSDNTPVATETYEEDGNDVTVNRYSDGSVNVLKVEQPADQSTERFSTQAISGCASSTSGSESRRTGCKVDFWYGLVSMSFYASFTYVTPGYDRIDEVWGARYTIGGACSTNRNFFGIQKKYENVYGPARARLEVQAQVCGVPYTTTFFLQLTVGSGGAQYTYG